MATPCQMPDRSGGWETGFAELFAEHPEIEPSIPSSHSADEQNRFRIFMRSLLRKSATKLFAVGLGQLEEAPDAAAPLGGIERHLDGVPHLEALSVPATTHHDRRRAGLQEPMLHRSLIIFGVQTDLHVRIRPYELGHSRIYSDLFRHVI